MLGHWGTSQNGDSPQTITTDVESGVASQFVGPSTSAPDFCIPMSSSKELGTRKLRPNSAWTNPPDKQLADKPEEGTFQTTTTNAICIRELYHWCATVSVLLMLQFVSDSLQHRFRRVPQPSEWSVVLLLLYAVASALILRYKTKSRPYAAYILAFGSFLMTCQLTWHWDSHVAQFKSSILGGRPLQDNHGDASALGYPLYGVIFGSSVADFLDAAACLFVLFQNCVQSTFLCRVGTWSTAIVSVLQWIVIVCWPFLSSHSHSAWFCRIAAMGLWTAHLIRSSYVWESEIQQQSKYIDTLRQAAAQSQQDLNDGQDADSVLNHVLKNIMADAMGCIELFLKRGKNRADPAFLSKASDILFRGMWWCKLREAILQMVAGRYEGKQEIVDVQDLTQDLVRGREVTTECPSRMLHLDSMACNVVLDNALTNASRHGFPEDPQVDLRVVVVKRSHDEGTSAVDAPQIDGEDFNPMCALHDTVGDTDTSTPVEVRFVVKNRAKPDRPLPKPWSSESPPEALPNDHSRPALSDGLGLQHIRRVANACGMKARLWQEDEDVLFELRVSTTSGARPPAVRSATPAPQGPCPFRDGVHILGLDDSDIARQNLEMKLTKMIPNATVAMFGKDQADVEEFKQAALEKGDILILDEHVDLPGAELHGSVILKELRAGGYRGFACIRSGDSTEADKARSLQSGAQWHVGKEVWMRDLIDQLRAEYRKFKEKEQWEIQPHEDLVMSRSSGSCAVSYI